MESVRSRRHVGHSVLNETNVPTASSVLLNAPPHRAQFATGCSQQARKMSARSRSVSIEAHQPSRRRPLRQHESLVGSRAGNGEGPDRLPSPSSSREAFYAGLLIGGG